jgi:tripeptide aminopeptidase
MAGSDLAFDVDRAIDRLMRFLAVEGVTGREKAIAREVARELKAVGVPARAIRHDTAHERIPLPTQTGNLIVRLPGTRPEPPLLFMTHLDTVPLCAGAEPVRVKDRIKAKGWAICTASATTTRTFTCASRP